MDREYWLVEFQTNRVWRISRLIKTEATTLYYLKRVKRFFAEKSPIELPDGTFENQMTLKDLYKLARKGEGLAL